MIDAAATTKYKKQSDTRHVTELLVRVDRDE